MKETDNPCSATFSIFESTQVALNNEFLSFIPPSIHQSSFFINLAEEMQLTFCEQIDNGCPVFLGLWDNILKTEKRLEECLRSWEEERSLEGCKPPSMVDVPCIKKSNRDLSQVNILIPETHSSCVLDSALIVPSDDQSGYTSSLLTGGSQLYIVSSDIAQAQGTQFLHCKIANVKTVPQNNVGNQREEKRAKSQDDPVKELYVDIAVNSANNLSERNKSSNQSFDLKIPSAQNPLDKLCQLLCIDEDETIEKRLCESEKKRKHEEKLPFKYFCDQCSFKTKRENHLLKHAKLHEKIKDIFCCNQCDFKTIRESVLCRHKMNHSATKLSCKLCPYKTDTKSFLLKHIQVRHGPNTRKRVKCNYCEFFATTPRELRRHHKLLHKPDLTKFWKCSKCPYKSKLRAHLTRHENDAHGSLRQFLCHYCGKSFKRNDTLTQHKATHGEVNKTFTCQHCGKVCTSSVFLREHLATHSNERPFLCDMCGSSFKTRGATQRHKRNMHSANVPVYPCTQCERTFKLRTDLNRHRKTHRLKTEATIVPAVISGANVQQEVISTPITIQVVYTEQLNTNNQDVTIK